jgi:eukaryotic-like serine/threonine-protein kinase
MPLASGAKLGPYEILSAIGAGGMGQVYRARDSKLGRDVAVKVLLEVFAHDSDRMARFQREAKVLASLNHPNIASVYGLEDSTNIRALVMELVEGSTLQDRIQVGPIPLDEVLSIAKQIAEALEYAHDRGIIHRDLKPANVKVTSEDAVKVLDFGLAKALADDPGSSDVDTSPTLSRMPTRAGVLLGTAAYMSPEQAKSKSVDRRADVWAFGCVLYEMLTGKKAFPGDSVADTLAAVIKEEPDWSRLPSFTPARVRGLLQRCLKKDAKQRLQAIGDARVAIDEIVAGSPEDTSLVVSRGTRPWVAWSACAVACTMALTVAFAHFRENSPAQPRVVRFQIPLPENPVLQTTGAFAVSPDGQQLVFPAVGPDGVSRLWVRALDSLEVRALQGTESSDALAFWAPNSHFVAFSSAGKLKKVNVSGGPAETLCDIPGNAIGGSWNSDGVIIFGQYPGVVMQVSAAGGLPSPLTALDPSQGEIAHTIPSFLPDGRHFIYLRDSGTSTGTGVSVGSLDVRPKEQSTKRIVASDVGPVYAPSADLNLGQLLFMRNGTLIAQTFDARRLELSGEAITVAEQLGTFLDYGFYSASTNGVLVYRSKGSGNSQLISFDRQGKVLRTAVVAGDYHTLAVSPDGTRAAVGGYGESFRLLDLSRGTSTQFTFGRSGAYGVWSPDGSRVVFASGDNLYQKLASGEKEEELLLATKEDKIPTSWSRDGRFLLYTVLAERSKGDLWVLPLEGGRKPMPFLRTGSNEEEGHFSADGRFVAYSSDESGRDEIYVHAFAPDSVTSSDDGGKWLISNDGGVEPRWRGDGRELYYITPDGSLMSVAVTTRPALQVGVAKVLFRTPTHSVAFDPTEWDLSPDGRRFTFAVRPAQSKVPFTIVLNWQARLKN